MKKSTKDRLEALVPAAAHGDASALNRIIAIIYTPVVRYCRARINDTADITAEDIAQETCLAVAQSLSRYEDRGLSFMSFVYGIAVNKVADARRRLYKDLSFASEDVPEYADSAYGPEEYALVLEGSNRVRKLLDSLNEKSRDIIILRVIVGLSADETAEILGSTPGAVRVAQHRALGRLRNMVEG